MPRDCRKAGDGALCPGDPGGEPHEPETGKKAGKIETTPFGNRKNNVRNQNCHFSRTDPITGFRLLGLGRDIFGMGISIIDRRPK